MAKQSGLGARFLVAGYDISGDVQALDTVHGGPALIDSTDITQSAHSRIYGQRDGSISFTSFFDNANATPVLKTLPTNATGYSPQPPQQPTPVHEEQVEMEDHGFVVPPEED